jgi:hypothetical protein
VAIVLKIGPHGCRKEKIKKRGVRMKVWSYCGVLLPTLLMLDLEHESPSAARYQRLSVIPVGFKDAGFCRNTGTDSCHLILFEKKISLPNFGTKIFGIKGLGTEAVLLPRVRKG